MYNEKDLIEHSELMHLLGYEDERSFKKWCDKQQIPIVKIGLKKYILSHFLTQYIDNQLIIFEKEKKPNSINKSIYNPKNEIISNYLKKYESASQTNPSKKTTS